MDTVVNKFTSNSIWFHEDDFCQIELQPKENLQSLLQDCKEIFKRSVNKFSPFLKIRTAERKIEVNDLISLFQENDFKVNKEVYSGTISYPKLESNIVAFTKNKITFYSKLSDNMVTNLFIEANIAPAPIDEYKNTLQLLGRHWNLLLVDWQRLTVVELENEEELKNYLLNKYKNRVQEN